MTEIERETRFDANFNRLLINEYIAVEIFLSHQSFPFRGILASNSYCITFKKVN